MKKNNTSKRIFIGIRAKLTLITGLLLGFFLFLAIYTAMYKQESSLGLNLDRNALKNTRILESVIAEKYNDYFQYKLYKRKKAIYETQFKAKTTQKKKSGFLDLWSSTETVLKKKNKFYHPLSKNSLYISQKDEKKYKKLKPFYFVKEKNKFFYNKENLKFVSNSFDTNYSKLFFTEYPSYRKGNKFFGTMRYHSDSWIKANLKLRIYLDQRDTTIYSSLFQKEPVNFLVFGENKDDSDRILARPYFINYKYSIPYKRLVTKKLGNSPISFYSKNKQFPLTDFSKLIYTTFSNSYKKSEFYFDPSLKQKTHFYFEQTKLAYFQNFIQNEEKINKQLKKLDTELDSIEKKIRKQAANKGLKKQTIAFKNLNTNSNWKEKNTSFKKLLKKRKTLLSKLRTEFLNNYKRKFFISYKNRFIKLGRNLAVLKYTYKVLKKDETAISKISDFKKKLKQQNKTLKKMQKALYIKKNAIIKLKAKIISKKKQKKDSSKIEDLLETLKEKYQEQEEAINKFKDKRDSLRTFFKTKKDIELTIRNSSATFKMFKSDFKIDDSLLKLPAKEEIDTVEILNDFKISDMQSRYTEFLNKLTATNSKLNATVRQRWTERKVLKQFLQLSYHFDKPLQSFFYDAVKPKFSYYFSSRYESTFTNPFLAESFHRKIKLRGLKQKSLDVLRTLFVGIGQATYTMNEKIQTLSKSRTDWYNFGFSILFRALFLSLLFASLMVKKIQTISSLTGKIAQGNLDVHFEVSSHDEIGILAGKLNTMVSGLKERETLMGELKAAGEIQKRLIPETFPEEFSDKVLFDGFYEPMHGVGGDYYDVIPIINPVSKKPEKFILVIADVSNHGVGPAIIMTQFRTNLRTMSARHPEPVALCLELNDYLEKETQGNIFITAFVGFYDLKSQKLDYVVCGHSEPIVIRSSGQVDVLEGGGIPLGAMPNDFIENMLKQESVALEKGDIFFQYTDGLNEAMDEKDELFEMERVIKFFEKNKHLKVNEFMLPLIKEVENFTGKVIRGNELSELNDDIAMVGFQVL